MSLEKTLDKAYYLAPEIFAEERERIFFSQWFCIGRSAEVPRKGDYLVVEVGGESVVAVRADSGRINAFYNVCRHRGSQLVPTPGRDPGDGCADFPCGHFRDGLIRCPYHGWAYSFAGGLARTPHIRGIRKDDPEYALHRVGVDEWGGYVFVRLIEDGSTATLAGQLGDIPDRLGRYPLSELQSGARRSYVVNANWKVILENYNECYHCAGLHPELCRIVPVFSEAGGANVDWDLGVPHRPGAYTFTASGTTSRAAFPGLDANEKTHHNGELAYPNLMLSLSCDHVASFVVWPVAADHTRIDCDFLFHPGEMAKPEFDPADAVEFWDVVNRQDWRICESVQRGMSSRAFEQGYYSPMEDLSLDIRRYVREKLGHEDV